MHVNSKAPNIFAKAIKGFESIVMFLSVSSLYNPFTKPAANIKDGNNALIANAP